MSAVMKLICYFYGMVLQEIVILINQIRVLSYINFTDYGLILGRGKG